MNKKLQVVLVLLTILLTSTYCNKSHEHGDDNKHVEHENEHNEALEGMAVLTPRQRLALNIELGKISMRNMSATIHSGGVLKVSPNDKAEITSFMGGNVKSIKVFQGNKVRKGQVLATLEHPDFIQLQQEYIEASNNYNFSKIDFERQKELYKNEAISAKIFQKTEAEFKNYKAKYEGLQIKLKMLNMDYKSIETGKLETELRIISPISGYVNKIDISLGSFVDAATKMFSISNNNNIHADLLVYEQDIPNVKIGQKARLQLATMPDIELTSQIFSIAKEYQKDSKAVLVHARIDNAPDKLIAGSYVNATIFTQDSRRKSVPESAIVKDGGKKYIFVFDANASEIANHSDTDGHAHDGDDGHNHKSSEHKHDDNDEHSHDGNDGHSHDSDDGHSHDGDDGHSHDGDDGHDHKSSEHKHGDNDVHKHDGDNGHNHDDGHKHENEAEHKHDDVYDNHSNEKHATYEMFANKKVAFRMVEVISGVKDNSYVEIKLMEPLDKDAQIVLDNAFYLLSDIKKSETEHVH